MNSYEFLENSRREIVALETLLTSIPAIAPEGGGDGEEKNAVRYKPGLAKMVLIKTAAQLSVTKRQTVA